MNLFTSSTITTTTRLFGTGGRGDGKTKKSKKRALEVVDSTAVTPSASVSSIPLSQQQPQLRVSNRINIPIRQQIRMAQLQKEYERSQHFSSSSQLHGGRANIPKPLQRTSFRRTINEEEREEKAAERRRKAASTTDWDVVLNARNGTASSPLVIVDGYNIIHKWSRLKKHMLKGDTRRARQMLVDDLENLASIKGWRIEVVFDGARRSWIGPLGSGPVTSSLKPNRMDQQSQFDVSPNGVRVVYTGVGIEADSYIESRCVSAKKVTDGTTTGTFIVATDDQMIRLAGQSAGALCLGADRFVNELKAVKQAVSYRVEAAIAAANGHAIRPEQLRGTIHRGRFGRGSVLIEDKRKAREQRKRLQQEINDYEVHIQLVEDENGIPWWAKLPNQTRALR